MSTQRNTSANTSINRTRLPKAFTDFKTFGHVLDLGCGKYTKHISDYCRDKGALSYNPCDKYNQPDDVNRKTLNFGRVHGFDTIFICNVLNVIDSEYEIENVVNLAWSMLRPFGKIIIQIYEGDRSYNGRTTKKDCYQRNEPTEEYLNYCYFSDCNVYKRANYIIIERS